MNEGEVSTYLGLKGMPALAEEIMIKRDIELLKYAGGRLHFSNISTINAVKLITEAKKSGLRVSCDVAIQNLLFDETVLSDYDTNYKVNPPLRSAKDIKVLEKAIKNDEIDVIVSSHSPQDEESKKLEFDHADFGMLGLQTFFPGICMKVADGDLSTWLTKFTVNPRKILDIPIPEIKVGQKANITIFDPEMEWKYDETSNFSKSTNSPFLGKKLTGAVIGVVNNGKSFFNKF
jgi:dihydroorotase